MRVSAEKPVTGLVKSLLVREHQKQILRLCLRMTT